MEKANELRAGTSRPDLPTNAGQRHSYAETRSPQSFEENASSHSHGIATIHEGRTVVAPISSSRDKTMSPPRSASATTGSSSTPVSLENVPTSGGADNAKGPSPDFAKMFTPPSSHQRHQHLQILQESGESRQFGGAGADVDTSMRQGSSSQLSGVLNVEGGAALKMLVSNNVAGSIIGRGGQTISELQNESNTRIKLSQSGDYYPGTQDRVCLVQGDPRHVKTALHLLLERFYLLQEAQHRPAWQPQQEISGPALQPGFEFVVRLLVPISCCGMIIGKAGSNIKFMEENTGVTSIRLSPKDDGGLASTMERVVTVTGVSSECCLQCVYLIFDGMTSHPDISRYSNMTTSYANCMAPSLTALPLTFPGPLGTSSSQHGMTTSATPSRPTAPEQIFWEGTEASQFHPGVHSGSGLTRRFSSSPDLPGALASDMQPHRFGHQGNFQERLIGYGLTSQTHYSLQIPQSSGSAIIQQSPLYLIPRPIDAPLLDVGRSPNGSDFHQLQQNHLHSSVSHSASAPNLLALQLEQSLHLSQPSPSPLHSPSPHHHIHQNQTHANHAFHPEFNGSGSPTLVPQTPTMIAAGCFNVQVLIPDSMIGSILGRGGRTLSELQMLSETRIRISQRGEYMPGTRSRIVNIRGQTAQSVWQAQYMMSQRMMLPPTATYNAPPTRSLSSGSYQQDAIERSDQESPP